MIQHLNRYYAYLLRRGIDAEGETLGFEEPALLLQSEQGLRQNTFSVLMR